MAKAPILRLSDAQRFDWLRLIRSENVGPRTFRALVNHAGGAKAALEALPELARRGGARKDIRIATAEEIERELAAARRLGVRFVALGEPEYPPALRASEEAPPPILAYKGREEALQQPAIAIVGSRNASAAGLAFADRLARGLGQAGYVVVSGLARGIDLRAHVAALETGTVGVLAGGHAKIYPPEAIPIAPRICEHGAVVSEMPIEWEPRGRDFPRRNRIVSGMALGTVVVEAARGSGSLITARFAGEQNREVFAVPGSPLDPRAEGANDLLREGAKICARVDDVLDVLNPVRAQDPFAIFREDPADPSEPLWGELPLLGVDPEMAPRARPAQAFDEAAGSIFAPSAQDALAEVERLLGPSPISLDDLADVAGLPLRQVRVAVTMLDLAGKIEHSGGGCVALLMAEEEGRGAG
jgi:DNA processing protein